MRLGELLVRTQPPEAERAARWFDRAIELHERGCALGTRDHWAALEGQALTAMMRGDYTASVAPLRASLERWPAMRNTHYNLACALCQTDDVDGCARELEAALVALDPPEALREQARPASYYRRRAAEDPDLAPLREDRARFAAIVAE